ncbi:hypothetical protein E2I00_020211, partial [Balaenoptera physalus]
EEDPLASGGPGDGSAGAQAPVRLEVSSDSEEASEVPEWLREGEYVTVGTNKTGVVRYVGPTDFQEGTWVGVELDLPTVGQRHRGLGAVLVLGGSLDQLSFVAVLCPEARPAWGCSLAGGGRAAHPSAGGVYPWEPRRATGQAGPDGAGDGVNHPRASPGPARTALVQSPFSTGASGITRVVAQ